MLEHVWFHLLYLILISLNNNNNKCNNDRSCHFHFHFLSFSVCAREKISWKGSLSIRNWIERLERMNKMSLSTVWFQCIENHFEEFLFPKKRMKILSNPFKCGRFNWIWTYAIVIKYIQYYDTKTKTTVTVYQPFLQLNSWNGQTDTKVENVTKWLRISLYLRFVGFALFCWTFSIQSVSHNNFNFKKPHRIRN